MATVALLVGAPAVAGERLSMHWVAPEACPDAASVERAVGALVGEAAVPDRPLEVVATVSPRGEEWEVVLERAGAESSRRVLRGRTCAAVSDAAVLIIALMIDPFAAPPPPLPRAEAGSVWRVGAWGGADWGALPGAGPTFGIFGSFQAGRQLFELALQAWVPQTVRLRLPTGAGGTITFALASLSTWRKLLDGPVSLGPSLGVELGLLHATGFGVTAPGTGAAPWVAARVGVAASWACFGRFELTVRVDGVVPFLRPRFVLTNVGDIHTPAPVGFRAVVGGALSF